MDELVIQFDGPLDRRFGTCATECPEGDRNEQADVREKTGHNHAP
jgi:hypothetical protein